jgi:hypothetical protein
MEKKTNNVRSKLGWIKRSKDRGLKLSTPPPEGSSDCDARRGSSPESFVDVGSTTQAVLEANTVASKPRASFESKEAHESLAPCQIDVGTCFPDRVDSPGTLNSRNGSFVDDSNPVTMSRSKLELAEAIGEFKKNYKAFAKENKRFLLIDYDVECAFQSAEAGKDIRHSAQLFGNDIGTVLRTIEKKTEFKKSKWISRVGGFLTKLYPIASLSLSLAAATGQANFAAYNFLTCRRHPSRHYKVQQADLVLFYRYSIYSFRAYVKLLEEESSRGEDFLHYLRRIEFEAAIIADNPNFDLGLETTQKFLEDKSTDLMSAIINFFNAALDYFCHDFARTF